MGVGPVIRQVIINITEEIDMSLRGLTDHERETVLVAIKDHAEELLDPDREHDVLDDDDFDDEE